ncbi:anosmin-1-like isoform X2 [Mya arenaria]|uniref:anosmin-1-like isoform X2 n=1 Tax=Mya arenaria TaxID=6604 RepID=UPI0022E86298|nr:anosmin-1-like isoform X2 [Mya arenaria]
METFKSFWITIVVVLSFGVAVVAGQNGLLSARCAARCLTEHKDSLRKGSDRNNHRKFMIDRCKNHHQCYQCMKPCAVTENELKKHNCNSFCEASETECQSSCEFLHYTYLYKPGDCPRPESAAGFEAVCLASCRADSDCPEETKCCPNLCGYVCRKPDFSKHPLPPVPMNLMFEERRQGRSLYVSWDVSRGSGAFPSDSDSPQGSSMVPSDDFVKSPTGGSQHLVPAIRAGSRRRSPVPSVEVFVLERMNTTSLRPVWPDDHPWTVTAITLQSSHLLSPMHAGHWYKFRVAMVTPSGSRGYSQPSTPFKSSRRVGKAMPPQNITEGATTLRKGLVDVTIHWAPPRYSDLPVWRYCVTWSERLNRVSPILIRIPVLEKVLPGNVLEFKLKKLKPGTTYHIQIEAIVKMGNRELTSNKASKYITTYAPPNMKQDHSEQVYGLYADIVQVEGLTVVDDQPYFDRGSLKAQLKWQVGEDFRTLVKSFMIFWIPRSCDQEYAVPKPYSATSDVPSFEIYDLQYECQYMVRVSAVTKSGVQGKPAEIRLRTPICGKIHVKGNSLPPECPDRVSQVPNSPRQVKPSIKKRNCSVDIELSWKHPRSDAPIASYLITYEMTDDFKTLRVNTDGAVYKQRPREITLKKVRKHVIHGLRPGEVYVIKVHAVSPVGVGTPAFVEILTPRILPCGSDKDPEPPDKPLSTQPPPVFNVTVYSSTEGSTNLISRETVTMNRNSINSTMQYSTIPKNVSEIVHIDIFRRFYYMFYFFSVLFSNS